MPDAKERLNELTRRYPTLQGCAEEVAEAEAALLRAVRGGGKLLLCGNGGSCADCDHISGELLKGFLSKRPLPASEQAALAQLPGGAEMAGKLQRGVCAIPLTALSAALTAFANDVAPEYAFAQLVTAVGAKGDVLLCISTSGNARNVCGAAVAARARGLFVIGLTGEKGGELLRLADVCIRVPGTETFQIQELHLPVYHCLCAMLEAELFGDAQ